MLGVKPALAQAPLDNNDSLNGVNVTAGLSQNGVGIYFQTDYAGNGQPAPNIGLSVTGSTLTGSNNTSISFRATDRVAALFQQTQGGPGADGTSGHNGQNGGASGAITTTLTNSTLVFNGQRSSAMPLIYGLYSGSLGATAVPRSITIMRAAMARPRRRST